MNSSEWIERAEQSLASARLLLPSDYAASCSRAYYAMHYAARAALIEQGFSEQAFSKTHSGLIGAFGDRIVQAGLIASEHGRALNLVERWRLRADYSAVAVSEETSKEAFARAEAFVDAVRNWLAAKQDIA